MRKFSKVAQGGACPRCGGTSFKAKRSPMGLLLLGVFAPKRRVACESCGKIFRRG
jgi:hypothetical protein